MFKLGITRREQLGNPTDVFRRNKEVSIPLIASLIKESQYSESVYPLFNTIRIGKTFKRTKKHRFEILDDQVAEVVASRFAEERTVVVHDLASSNGTTSCQFYQTLKKRGVRCRFLSSDKFTHLYFVTPQAWGWTVVLDTDLEAMQYVGHGMVLGRQESAVDLVNRGMAALLDRCLYPKARDLLASSFPNRDDFNHALVHRGEGTAERFPLVSPECLATMTSTDDFIFSRRDLFQGFAEQVEVVRALNILNRDYFSEELLRQAVRNILAGLRENGLFVVGRSHDEADEEHNVTIFKKQSGRFTPLRDFMKGTEIRQLILAA